MSYLCIDVEWNIPANQAENIEMLSIGAACWDSDYHMTRTYFKLIRPERMDLVTPTTYRLLNLGPVVLGQAKSCSEVLHNFDESFRGHGYITKEDAIVFWNSEALNLLKREMDKVGLSLPSNKIVVLQDVLSFADKDNGRGRSMGFESALRHYQVHYRRELLHNSKYDAQYLIDLYDAAYDRLAEVGDKKTPLVHTKYSKVLHHADCHYVKGREITEGFWEDALIGWHLCSCCGKRGDLRAIRIPKVKKPKADPVIISLPKTEKVKKSAKPPKAKKSKKVYEPLNEVAFAKHCENLGINCHFSIGWVFLRTPVSFWKIQHEETRVLDVLHQSMRVSNSLAVKHKSRTHEGFHQQKVYDKDIYGTLKYIYEHDKHFLYPKYTPSYWGNKQAN